MKKSDAAAVKNAPARRPKPPAKQSLLNDDPPAAVWVDPARLQPWAQNPRLNDGEPVERVAASIQRFGFGAPIVARQADGEIIAGHTRWKAAKQLGLTLVPVRYLDVSEADAHALALADNRLGELAPWNQPLLYEVLAAMPDLDQQVAGWNATQLADLAQAVAAPEPPPDVGPDGAPASFGLYTPEALAEAHVAALAGRKQSDYAPPLADVMVALNRCQAGRDAALSRVTDRWFPHRYDVMAGTTARQTPNQQLSMPSIVRACVGMTTGVMKQWGTQREILNNILLTKGQCARQFPIDRARDLYRQFAPAGGAVLDPCAGWGGRLLGWLCSGVGGSYTGFDAGKATAQGFARMIAELNIANAAVTHAAYEDVPVRAAAYDFAFTSPPYFTLEHYSDDPQQAEVRYPTYPKWVEGFLRPLVANTLQALKPGAVFVLNVSDHKENKLAQDAAVIARAMGAAVEHRAIDIGTTRKMYHRENSELEDLLVLTKAGAK